MITGYFCSGCGAWVTFNTPHSCVRAASIAPRKQPKEKHMGTLITILVIVIVVVLILAVLRHV